jgi:ADP-ribosyl-[dinitrogen reductase] hydrolase
MRDRHIAKDILFGLAVGDALGVPVEFQHRESLAENPVKGMRGYGTHGQPAGTFSDDSSLAFCLAEVLTTTFDMDKIARKFISWLRDGYWTAWGSVFDVGMSTRNAIARLEAGCKPDSAGGINQNENGNGSLMRILPLVVHIKDMPVKTRFKLTCMVSSITHRHPWAIMACFYYLEFARLIIKGISKEEAYQQLKIELPLFLQSTSMDATTTSIYRRLLEGNIFEVDEQRIYSGGFVANTLEASIWCLMTTHSYTEAVLKAVNLGGDTDTTAAVTGGLAGLVYGYKSIPDDWMKTLARRDDIEDLGERMYWFCW